MHRGFFLPVKAFPPAPNGPGTGGGRCHATYLCGERFNSRPPRGGRHRAVVRDHECRGFQSTPSARRATQRYLIQIQGWSLFQSTPSARRATTRVWASGRLLLNFNPRPPRGGRRVVPVTLRPAFTYFNPRPPRGGRRAPTCTARRAKRFQSTPSARRATYNPSVPALISGYFNPRPPRGGRRGEMFRLFSRT